MGLQNPWDFQGAILTWDLIMQPQKQTRTSTSPTRTKTVPNISNKLSKRDFLYYLSSFFLYSTFLHVSSLWDFSMIFLTSKNWDFFVNLISTYINHRFAEVLRVDLPQPLLPTTAVVLPARRSKVILDKTCTVELQHSWPAMDLTDCTNDKITNYINISCDRTAVTKSGGKALWSSNLGELSERADTPSAQQGLPFSGNVLRARSHWKLVYGAGV